MAVPAQCPFPQVPLSTPQEPCARTDGKCLILKGVKIDGKKYDLRIWRWNSEGDEMAFKEGDPFSKVSLLQIQDIAKGIFEHYPDPSQVKISYRDQPEECFAINEHVEPKNRVVSLMNDGELLGGAQKIHRLLFPELRAEVTTDPNLSPLTYLKLAAPVRTAPIEHRANSAPQAVPDVQSVSSDEKMIEAIDQGTKATRPAYFENLTYANLVKFSAGPKDVNDPLYPAYSIYEKLVRGEKGADDEAAEKMKQMRKWIENIYISACKYRHEKLKDHFDHQVPKDGMQKWGETFEDWCKYYAAHVVLSYVNVKADLQPMIAELRNIDPFVK